MNILRTFLLAVLIILPLPSFAQSVNTETNEPIRAGVSYTADLFSNVAGGQNTGIVYLDNVNVDLELNLEESPLGWSGTTLYAYGMGNQGGSISELAGDLQGVSNIEAENSWRIYELWLQKKLMIANSSLLVGLYDINTEFNALSSSQLFINSSHGIDPSLAFSGTLGPSIFPYTSFGARLKVNPYKGLILQAAVLDGVPSDPGNTRGTKVRLRDEDGIFLIGEVGYHSYTEGTYRNRNDRLQSMLDPGMSSDNSISVGAWYYSKQKASLDPAGRNENEYGVYVSGEYELRSADRSTSGIKVFSRAGLANEGTATVHAFLSGGLVAGGLFSSRAQDHTGLAIAYARVSDPYLNSRFIDGARPERAETNIELTHLFMINERLQIQADLQYILNPGLNRSLDNALILGSRFILSL